MLRVGPVPRAHHSEPFCLMLERRLCSLCGMVSVSETLAVKLQSGNGLPQAKATRVGQGATLPATLRPRLIDQLHESVTKQIEWDNKLIYLVY